MENCVECEKHKKNLVPISERNVDILDEDELSGKYICSDCLEDSERFAYCDICHESHDIAYYKSDLKPYNGVYYCKVHYSEMAYDEYDNEEDE